MSACDDIAADAPAEGADDALSHPLCALQVADMAGTATEADAYLTSTRERHDSLVRAVGHVLSTASAARQNARGVEWRLKGLHEQNEADLQVRR
jgi:hypothetical protein